MLRRAVKHATSLKERIAERAKVIATKAGTFPPGSKERERMERRAMQAPTGSDINEWLSSGTKPRECFSTNSYDYREEEFVRVKYTIARCGCPRRRAASATRFQPAQGSRT